MKRLVVCCDGTWDDADAGGSFSNVVRLSRAIKAVGATPGGPVEQVVYYQAGVGTGSDFLSKMTGGALGLGLSRNVRDAYAFLANNYCDGDELFLFGFSRGAYTARSVAGLIGWAGLLHKVDMDDFALLWENFKLRGRAHEPSEVQWEDMRIHFPDRHKDVPIKCVGVWDTVGALGIPGHIGGFFQHFYNFHDTDLGAHIECALQALAIDEHRRPYQPTLWAKSADAPEKQRLEQVWFAGAHADVGGGYEKHGLSDITLAWMVDRVSDMLDVSVDYLGARQDKRTVWALGTVHDSAEGLTGWFGRLDRPLLKTADEAIHESVEIRIKAGTAATGGMYSPRNLPSPPVYTPLRPVEKGLIWSSAVPGASGATGRPSPTHVHSLLLDINSGDK